MSQSRSETAFSERTICQLVHGLPVGGAEVLVNRIVRRLRSRYRFVITCLDEVGQLGEVLANEGMRVVHLGRRPGFDLKCIRKLHGLFAAEGIRIVHAHQHTPFAYALATRFFGRRPPILFTEHGRFFPDYPSRKRKWFNRLLSDSRDRFVAVGKSVRQALIENEGLPAQRVELIYNGIEFSSLRENAVNRTAARAELGLSDNQCMILQVARLDPIKDHKTAIHAVRLAARRNPHICLFIAGYGPEEEAIEQAICNESMGGRIKILGLRNDIPRLLAAADVFLLTSLSEGVPVTLMEAMAVGVPVTATDVGGVSELVENGVTGLLAPARDATRLADALIQLSMTPALRASLAATAKVRVESDFAEERMIASYNAIYAEMLKTRALAA